MAAKEPIGGKDEIHHAGPPSRGGFARTLSPRSTWRSSCPINEDSDATLTLVIAAILLSLTAISGGSSTLGEPERGESGSLAARIPAVVGFLTLALLGSADAVVAATGEEILYGIPCRFSGPVWVPNYSCGWSGG